MDASAISMNASSVQIVQLAPFKNDGASRPIKCFSPPLNPPPKSSSNAATGVYCEPDSADLYAVHFAKLKELPTRSSLWPNDSEMPSEKSIALAARALRMFKRFGVVPSKVVASADGGVAICIMQGAKYSDIECLNSGEILAVNSDKKGAPDVWDVGSDDNSISVSISRIRSFLKA